MFASFHGSNHLSSTTAASLSSAGPLPSSSQLVSSRPHAVRHSSSIVFTLHTYVRLAVTGVAALDGLCCDERRIKSNRNESKRIESSHHTAHSEASSHNTLSHKQSSSSLILASHDSSLITSHLRLSNHCAPPLAQRLFGLIFLCIFCFLFFLAHVCIALTPPLAERSTNAFEAERNRIKVELTSQDERSRYASRAASNHQ